MRIEKTKKKKKHGRRSLQSYGAPSAHVGLFQGKWVQVGQGHMVRLAGSCPSARQKYVLLGRNDLNNTDNPKSTRPCPERGVDATQAASVLTSLP